jgi:hypothetical protein
MEQEKKYAEFTELVTPLIKWLDKNCHPHTTVIVDALNAELLEGEMVVNNEDYKEY